MSLISLFSDDRFMVVILLLANRIFAFKFEKNFFITNIYELITYYPNNCLYDVYITTIIILI